MVLVVEIEDQSPPKPFLGGWRDVGRGLEYHDATCQTTSGRKPGHANAQTSARTRSKSTAVGGVDRCVQTACLPGVGDKLLDLAELRRSQLAATIIQRWYRAHRARQSFADDIDKGKPGDEAPAAASEVDTDEPSEDRSASVEATLDYLRGAHGEFHILGQSGPRDSSDLALMRTLLDRWGVAEEARIRGWTGPDKAKAVAQRLRLKQEVEILRAIDAAKRKLTRRQTERARANFIDELAVPLQMKVSWGGDEADQARESRVEVETLRVQRAREFRDLYETLVLEDDDWLEEGDRVELLFGLKRIAMQHTCAASSSLEKLIEQELFLISNRAEPAKLSHLRSRVRLSFLHLARGVLLTNNNRITGPMKTKLCPSCGKLRSIESFEADHRGVLSRTCVDCVALRPRRRDPEVCLDIYGRMLEELRESEATRPDGANSLAFAVGARDIRYLVSNIWHGRSGISGCSDVDRLRLARLDSGSPWAPWNCLLATKREICAHQALRDAYDPRLERRLRTKNLQARLYFRAMAKLQ